MKKLINKALFPAVCLTLCMSFSVPALAYDSSYSTNYGFSSGPDSGETFGNSTGYNEPTRIDPLTTNQRRNKDAADLPPAYGYFSGDIPTDESSPYHDNSPSASYTQISGSVQSGSYTALDVSGNYSASTSSNNSNSGVSAVSANYSDQTGVLQSTSTSSGYNTVPKYFDDGSMGKLYIESANKTLKVYEGETLENMRTGIGHFESTSAWDGNVGFAGHNRGASAYFSFVKKMEIGDEITYTTPYGTRTYRVYRKEKINEYDYSGLGWTVDNVLSLITCVENQSELRWIVQASEIR